MSITGRGRGKAAGRVLGRARLVALLAICIAGLVLSGAPSASALILKKDITYKTVNNIALKLDVRMPSGTGPFPGVVLIHGGKNITGDKCQANLSSLEKQYVGAGFVVYTPNYRLAPAYPQNPNLSPMVKCANGSVVDVSPLQGNLFPAQQNDLSDAITWVKNHAGTYKTDASRIAAIGTSSGGSQAYMQGDFGNVKVAVGFSGPTYYDNTWGTQAELKDYFGCTYSQCPGTWSDGSPLDNIGTNTAKFTDIYNSSNEQVPISNADRYYKALQQHGFTAAEENIIPGSKHATAYLGTSYNGTTVLQDSIAYVKAHV